MITNNNNNSSSSSSTSSSSLLLLPLLFLSIQLLLFSCSLIRKSKTRAITTRTTTAIKFTPRTTTTTREHKKDDESSENPFCSKYHPIRAKNLYDPSAPILDLNGKVWHVWEDLGSWSHFVSEDLIHWTQQQSTTNFSADTGSISVTPSGAYAFWPILPKDGDINWIASAQSIDPHTGLNQWKFRGKTIAKPPAHINRGFRDPTRAFQYDGEWYIGVGCGNNATVDDNNWGAHFCVWRAKDDTLAEFEYEGFLFSTNQTFGHVDSNIVWQSDRNVSVDMLECPDLFPLGRGENNNKWVLLASLYQTNQWWIGTLVGKNPPRFVPEKVGILDYGNGYAAKSGTEWIQSSTTRRLLFAFTGWDSGPTAIKECGNSFIIPREIDIDIVANDLIIRPIPETKLLRIQDSRIEAHISSSTTTTTTTTAARRRVKNTNNHYYGDVNSTTATTTATTTAFLVQGSQVEIRLLCTGLLVAPPPQAESSSPHQPRTPRRRQQGGRVGVRVLGSSAASFSSSHDDNDDAGDEEYTEIGYDLGNSTFYVDHSKCCVGSTDSIKNNNTIIQRAPLDLSTDNDDDDNDDNNMMMVFFNMTVFVDGGLIEAFANDRKVITSMVSPTPRLGIPNQRTNVVFITTGFDDDENPGGSGPRPTAAGDHQQSVVECQASSWQLRL